MRLARLSIHNFRNFEAIDIALAGNVVLLGENRVGKSNLLFAIRLVLDPTLPDAARQLKLSDFWDGCDLAQGPQIEVHLDFWPAPIGWPGSDLMHGRLRGHG